jgi:hypothetical protein
MRRCRMAQLYGEMIDERFSDAADSMFVGGYVHVIRPDLACWPLRWTITVENHPVQSKALALAG